MKQINFKQKKTVISRAFLLLLAVSLSLVGYSQVTIGSGLEPKSGAILELKEQEAGVDNETGTKGMLYSRVKLRDKNQLFPMFVSVYEPGGAGTGNWQYKDAKGIDFPKAAEDRSHIGLGVYNVARIGNFVPGFYIWDGAEWRFMDNSPAVEPIIDRLLCLSATLTPSTYKKDVYYEGVLRVPYIGGNGGVYSGGTVFSSANVTGLTAELVGGKLVHGGGEIIYRVSGYPSESSPQVARFNISFLNQGCPSVVVGMFGSSLNVCNLAQSVTIDAVYALGTNYYPPVNEGDGNMLVFDKEILVPEDGNYAVSLRMYGGTLDGGTTEDPNRCIFYVFLVSPRGDGTGTRDILDAAEINLHKLGGINTYSVTLGCTLEANRKLQVVTMCYKSPSLPYTHTWTLYPGFGGTASTNPSQDPIRTSLVWWKL